MLLEQQALMFFIPCDNWKIEFSIKIYRYPRVLFNRYVPAFSETNHLKVVHILFFLSPE